MTNVPLAMIGEVKAMIVLLIIFAAAGFLAVVVSLVLLKFFRSKESKPGNHRPRTNVVPPVIQSCPQCGASLKPDAPEGLCPACLFKVGQASSLSPGAGPAGTASAFTPPSIAELEKLFPQLQIIEPIGRGGMGAVYKARQPGLDRLVALKILAKTSEGDLDFAGRFTREARALAKLSHPNIVGVYDFGQINVGQASSLSPSEKSEKSETGKMPVLHYFIMEYVDGPNLRQIQQAGKLSPREALQIIPQICAALQFAHDEGIVHRDIKPENVLLDKKGRVKIADFGLAKILGQEKDFRLTGAKDVMGTPHYMAPEQVEKPQEVDHRADIYSLGVVFYEMLTGELPLGKFQPPSAKVQVDVRLDEVVLRSLAKEPERRYQQASEIKTRLETIAGSEMQKADGGGQKTENGIIAATTKFSVTAVVGAVAVVLAQGLLVFCLVISDFHFGIPRPAPGSQPLWFSVVATLLPFLILFSASAGTILGWIAVSQIRRSAGKLWGLGLAVFDALFFPLLALDAIIFGFAMWVAFNLSPSRGAIFNLKDYPAFLYLGALAFLFVALVDVVVIRKTWNAINSLAEPSAVPSKQNRWKRVLTRTAGVVAILLITHAFVLAPYRAETDSMSPEIPHGSHVFVYKLARRFSPGDIIVYRREGINFLGRVITQKWGTGLPDIVLIERRDGNMEQVRLSKVIGRVVFNTRGGSESLIKSDYIGQMWLPKGDSIEIDSVERTKTWMVVRGRYELVSADSATLALYITSTNPVARETPEQRIQIFRGGHQFELVHTHLVPGLPHVSMYADGKPFASVYFGTEAEAREESNAGWITNKMASAETWAPSLAPGEKPALDKILDEASELMKQGRYEDALQRHLWYHKHALEFEPAQRGVRLSFALANWMELARRYPKARQAMIEICDRDTQAFAEGRGYSDLFQDVASLNQHLQNEDATYALFKNIYQKEKPLARQCYFYAEELLVKRGDYDLCLELLGDPQQRFDTIRRSWEMQKQMEQRNAQMQEEQSARLKAMSETNAAFAIPALPETPALADEYFVKQACQLIQILVGAGRKTTAEEIRKRALALVNDERLKSSAAPAEVKDGASSEQLMQEGWRLWQERKLDQAAAKFREAVELQPTNANAWNGLGWVTFNAGKADEAEKAFQKAIALEPDYPAALNGLGQIYLSQRNYDLAETYLLRAGMRAPAAWHGLTRLYLLEGKFDEAERWAQTLVDTGQADETVKKMLEAAKAKKLSEGLRMVIEPPPVSNRPDAGGQNSTDAAVAAGQTWLALLDEEKYAESWQKSAAVFRGAVDEAAWKNSLNTFRKPLGRVLSRKLLEAQTMSEMPGAPDGHYVVMQFESSFANKKSAIETVTFGLEPDGKWKSSGYFVK